MNNVPLKKIGSLIGWILAALFGLYILTRYWFITSLLILAALLLVIQTLLARKFQFRNRLSVYLVLVIAMITGSTYFALQADIPTVFAVSSLFKNNIITDPNAAHSPAATPTLTTEEQIQASFKEITAKVNNPVALAVYHDGQLITAQTTDEPFYTASIVKVSIAALLLHNATANKQALSAEDMDELTNMIENSDNDATTYLLEEKAGGFTALADFFKTLGMDDTVTTNETIGWGLTQTTASDQIKLLRMVFEPSDYLTANDQATLKNLMLHVAEDQQFGLGILGDDVALKNGWLPDEKDDGSETWIVNSIGEVPLDDGSHYLMVVLTSENETQEAGEKLIETIATKVDQILHAK